MPGSVPFLGMRGTGDWVTNQRPENWRQTLLRLYPNGKAPLTAILSMLKSESTGRSAFPLVDQAAGQSASGHHRSVYQRPGSLLPTPGSGRGGRYHLCEDGHR